MNPPVLLPDGIYRATLAIVDLDAIAHNYGEIKGLLPRSVAVCAVVKADAYGHGAGPVSKELEALGVDSFGVATVEEGVQLRKAGIQRPVLILGNGLNGMDVALEHDLTPVISSLDSAREISQAANKARRKVPVHLKLDTGMGRLGLMPDQWRSALEELQANQWVSVQGLASHLSSADSDPEFTLTQLERFNEALEQATELLGTAPELAHIANSAGIMNHPESFHTMVRPGIALYGVYPDRSLVDKVQLRPAMTFVACVSHIKEFPPGRPISYGQTFHTERPSRIAVLSAGYADGYRRDLSNRGAVLVRGFRAPVVGTVTMDMTMIDVTDAPDVIKGDEVILFGPSPGGDLPVEEVAQELGTIPYELLCAVSRRVPRVYTRGGSVVESP